MDERIYNRLHAFPGFKMDHPDEKFVQSVLCKIIKAPPVITHLAVWRGMHTEQRLCFRCDIGAWARPKGDVFLLVYRDGSVEFSRTGFARMTKHIEAALKEIKMEEK